MTILIIIYATSLILLGLVCFWDIYKEWSSGVDIPVKYVLLCIFASIAPVTNTLILLSLVATYLYEKVETLVIKGKRK